MKKNNGRKYGRISLFLLSSVLFLSFAACDTKMCYCYETTSTGVLEQEVYTNTETYCNALSNNTRTCVEQNERMNPEDIAWK